MIPLALALAEADRDLAGSHTLRHEAPCTLHVSPSGRDGAEGRSEDEALRTPGRAVELAEPGDVVCFAPGRYPALAVADVQATAEAPLVFRRLPGAERAATLASGSREHGAGIWIGGSQHVHLYDLHVTDSQTGVSVSSSAFVRVEGLSIEAVGQAALSVSRQRGAEGFAGPASHHCDLVGNAVRDTGLVTARYGEGIYVGSGGLEGDDTHDVFVAYNHIEGVRAEADDVKPYTSRVVVRGNEIVGGSHFFHGAISVGVQAFPAPGGEFLVEGNRIRGFGSTGGPVAGISVGHGDTVVRDNLVQDIEGGVGIRTTTTFANPEANEVVLEGNTVWTPGGGPSISLHDGDERTGMTDGLGRVELRDNRTDDGSAGSTRLGDPPGLDRPSSGP